ncbi:terpene synthase 04 [Tasmannia lanceolata]|uniref:terpene synthase 04 n=1 Tax=Tasmannia lanceolata TaxID=3420 RepID=UPI004062DEA8
MEMESTTIEGLVESVKEEMFSSSIDLYTFVSPSAYDTAWMAIIPNPQHPNHPMFTKCLDWVLGSQREEGFWGEPDSCIAHNLECLSATLACIIALNTWHVGSNTIAKGLAFVHANTERIIAEQGGGFPRWFAIIFSGMLDIARSSCLDIFPGGLPEAVNDVYNERQRILQTDNLHNQSYYPPLISYLEALPATYHMNHDQILRHQSEDGSLVQSPSATAQSFMLTSNEGCMLYLEAIDRRFWNGVPHIYPIDEELIKLCMVDRIERLGLAEHFSDEIKQVLRQVYGNWASQEPKVTGEFVVPAQIYKDSLAFRLLRMHGYHVSSRRICWFLSRRDILLHMEANLEYFLNPMLNIYRAADLTFLGENDLEEAKSVSKILLEKGTSMKNRTEDSVMFQFHREIEHELRISWLARLDHMEHRVCIEGGQTNYLLMGKTSFYRLSRLINNTFLLQLAKQNFTLRQSIYRAELEELKRWSMNSGLSNMGFGREKTEYLYFAIASTVYHPSLSDVRMIITKSAILVTVADDFFDMEGSLDELNKLTEGIQRWEGGRLCGHSKVIFDALNDLVNDLMEKSFDQQRQFDLMKNIRSLWHQTFWSWLKEAEWSRSRHAPFMDEYVEVGKISIAVHTSILPSFFFVSPVYVMQCSHTERITELLMVCTRLLNDIQSYQKEKEEGKMNLVLLYLKENPEANIEDSIAHIRQIFDKNKKELLEHILVDGISVMPKACKQIHLSSLKVFQMFYNSSNAFDSPTEMLGSIKTAIYEPLMIQF